MTPLLAGELDVFSRAENALHSGRVEEARDGFAAYLVSRQSAVAGGRSGWLASDAIAIERLTDLCSHLGDEDVAEQLIQALADIQQRAGNSYGYRVAVVSLATSQLRRNRLRTALETLDRLASWTGDPDAIDVSADGLERWERSLEWPSTQTGDRAALLASYYYVLARIFAANGRYGPALVVLARARKHAALPEGRYHREPLVFAQAQCLVECGRFDEAAEKLREAKPPLGSPQEIAILEFQSAIEWAQGKLGNAVALCREAMTRTDALRLTYARAAIRLQLAEYLALLNKTVEADALVSEARTFAEALHSEDLSRRVEELSQVIQLRRRSQAAPVLSVNELQDMDAEEEPDSPQDRPGAESPVPAPAQASFLELLDSRILEMQRALSAKDLGSAAALLEGLQAFGGSDSPLISARLYTARGLVLYRQSRFADASEQFAVARAAYSALGMLPETRQIHRYQIWCAAKQGNDAAVAAHRQEEGKLLERMSESLESSDQSYFWLNKWTQEEERFSAEIAALSRLRNRCLAVAGFKGLVFRATFLWQLSRFLSRIDSYREQRSRLALSAAAERPPTAWPHWLEWLNLSKRRATLSFLVLPDRVFSACVWRFGADIRVTAVERSQLRELVHQLHEQLPGYDPRLPELQTLAKVSDLLGLSALTSLLPPETEAISVVPDDILHGVPFAAVPVNGNIMIERWAVSSSATWAPPLHESKVGSMLVTAVPDAGPQYQPLPQATREVATAIDASQAPQAAISSAVTVQQLKDTLRRTGMWHAACHGISQPKEPGASGLALAGGEVLVLREIAALDARGLRLAVLASCWSADNYQYPGRIVVSLPQALQLAGVETIVGSLWRVLDELGPAFIAAFYEALRAGVARDQALRQAMLSVRKDQSGNQRPLADWAGFVLFGDPARLIMNW
jgi:CHAT domain-containing protein/tetratricopeptide (TPR) repeat protein